MARPNSPITGSTTPEAMASMMRGVVTRGTAASAFSGHPVTVVGKTGTSQNHADAWFVGLTPHLAVGVWVGRDDNRTMGSGITGGRSAAVITADMLERAQAAGMISTTGYRDDKRDPGQLWPPDTLAPGRGPEIAQLGDDGGADNLGNQNSGGGRSGQSTGGSEGTGSSGGQADRPSSAFVGSGGLY